MPAPGASLILVGSPTVFAAPWREQPPQPGPSPIVGGSRRDPANIGLMISNSLKFLTELCLIIA